MSHAVLHRWKVRRGKEEDFVAAWARVTDLMIEQCGAFGARLHKAEDGSYIAYSWWPSRQVWSQAQTHLPKSAARALMAAAIEERLPETHMAVVGEVFQSEDRAEDQAAEGEPALIEEAEEAAPESNEPAVPDFDPDDPNAPL